MQGRPQDFCQGRANQIAKGGANPEISYFFSYFMMFLRFQQGADFAPPWQAREGQP